jgi:DNA polymerase III subunit epsilon
MVIAICLIVGIAVVGFTLLSYQSMSETEGGDGHDWSMLPEQFVVVDLETTGLSAEWDEIIEIGAIRATRGTDVHDTFQVLIKPDKKVPKRITELTGISQEMVDSKGMALSEVLPQFLDFIGDRPLVAFNAPFDMGFLKNAAKKHNLTIKNRHSCALKMARRAWPGLPSYRLSELAKTMDLPDDDTHRALGDCHRAWIVYAAAAHTLGVAS